MKDYHTRARRLWLAEQQPHLLEDAAWFAAGAAFTVIAVIGLLNGILAL